MNIHDIPKGWEAKTVQELCGQPQYGYTASANIQPIGPKLLRITDIQEGNVNWATVPYCECNEVEKYKLQTNDILFARTGATTGKSYLVKSPPLAVFASYLIRIRPGNEILPEYLFHYFQSPYYWRAVLSGIDEGNRPTMNGSKLAKLKILFPKDKEEQQRIVSRIEALTKRAEEARKMAKEVEAELDSFTPALLSKAFRGEL